MKEKKFNVTLRTVYRSYNIYVESIDIIVTENFFNCNLFSFLLKETS